MTAHETQLSSLCLSLLSHCPCLGSHYDSLYFFTAYETVASHFLMSSQKRQALNSPRAIQTFYYTLVHTIHTMVIKAIPLYCGGTLGATLDHRVHTSVIKFGKCIKIIITTS